MRKTRRPVALIYLFRYFILTRRFRSLAVDNESDKILKADSVNDGVLRKKLSKQMKLVLEDTESLEIPKDVDLSALGDFECKIVLESGLKVPFNVSVVRR